MLLEKSGRRNNIQACSQHHIRCFVEKCSFAVSVCKALKNGTSTAHVLELALNLSQDPLDASEKSRYGGTTAIWVCGI